MSKEEYLKSLHTRQLLSILATTRVQYGIYETYVNNVLTEFTYDEIKNELSTREHVPSRAESKRNRQKMAKQKR